jgi:hypothetical protein
MQLYFQIPDALMHHKIGLNFNDKNQLTVLAASLFLVLPSKDVQVVSHQKDRHFMD